jgi:hypothetical protein
VLHIFPQELESGCFDFEQGERVPGIKWPWSLKKLQQAPVRLTNFATAAMKFCFFID